MKFNLSIILLFTFTSCILNNNDLNSLDSILANDFNEHEIDELKDILYFFDNNVKSQTKTENVKLAYNQYMENLRYTDSPEDFERNLMIDKLPVDSFIFASNGKSVFSSIYIQVYGTDMSRIDTLTSQLVPNLQGDYLRLIDKAIEYDSTFNSYKETLESSGEIAPPLAFGFQNIHEHLDFDNELIRLLVALHYISLKSLTRLKV